LVDHIRLIIRERLNYNIIKKIVGLQTSRTQKLELIFHGGKIEERPLKTVNKSVLLASCKHNRGCLFNIIDGVVGE